MRNALLALCLLLGLLRPVKAQEPTVPAPRGYVSDYVGVLDAATVRGLDALIGELKAKTGAEIAVVVVNSTQPLTASDYAMKVAEAWKPGSKRLDTGVVFVAALKDRQMYILTGYGVEGILPDGKVGEIRDEQVRPAFRRGDYAGGVRAATLAIATIIAASDHVQLTGQRAPEARSSASAGAGLLLVLLVVIFLLLALRVPLLPLLIGMSSSGRGGFGDGGFSGGGGGFGGFGGGSFGGGGAGGDW